MKITDSHTDFLTALSEEEIEQYVKTMKKSNVKIVSCAVFTTEKKHTLAQIQHFQQLLITQSQKHKINLLLSIEDCGVFHSLNDLIDLATLRPFSATLTWNEKNQFAFGAHSKGGLTNLGKQAIALFEENKILVDTAHLNRQSFYEFAKLTKLPIYNSHSNIYALHRHPRNLTEKQIEMIVSSNGFLGLTLYEKFISNKGQIKSKDIALQFDYLIKKFGHKNFGLGTDLYGIDPKFLPQDLQSYEDLKNLKTELQKLGHSNNMIDCIFHKNFEDFINRTKKIKSDE